MFDVIAFDADDTLWENERLYDHGRERFREVLRAHTLDRFPDEILNAVEVDNLRHYGYGVMSFTLSMIETAIQITGGKVTGPEIAELIDLAKEMLSAPVHLFEGTEAVVSELSKRRSLMLITKGDLLHQRSKVDRSGLRGYFDRVEIVSDKRVETYQEILVMHGISPNRFLMVGNSLRSDILPVIELGGRAIYVPNPLTWSHEHGEVPESGHGRFVEVGEIGQVPAAIERLEREMG